MSKTTENIKNIWKKSMIEVTNEVFDEVIKTAAEESSKPILDPSHIIACMSMVRDRMENTMTKNGITDEDIPVVKQNQDAWTKESMPWMMDLIMDRLKIKETLIKHGGNND